MRSLNLVHRRAEAGGLLRPTGFLAGLKFWRAHILTFDEGRFTEETVRWEADLTRSESFASSSRSPGP